MASDINLIQNRRREIARELGEAQEKLSRLQAEDRELEVAERVLARLHERNISPDGEHKVQYRVLVPRAYVERSQKPEAAPTMPDMILEALSFAMKTTGRSGLEPKDMADYIAKKWWPEVTINNVGPIAWRMWKRKQLGKDGSIYSLLKNETPDSLESGASDHNGAGNGSPSSSGSKEASPSLAAFPDANPAHPGA